MRDASWHPHRPELVSVSTSTNKLLLPHFNNIDADSRMDWDCRILMKLYLVKKTGEVIIICDCLCKNCPYWHI